ncbi:MAG: ribonuclease III [Bryobacterales bacterium]|jgi:ribonuclease III|nr:ribonuclease III [Bryobacterales bacterium]
MRAEPESLESLIGYRFTNRDILLRALTHRSHVYENVAAADEARPDNEQLEFLGDAVLGFLISECLVRRFPAYPEGRLSKLRAHLVSAAHLFEVASELGLGEYLLLGRGEEMSGGRTKKTLLVDALEALIAAIFLDGGMDSVRAFVYRFVVEEGNGDGLPDGPADYKSALQELAQAKRLPAPRYLLLREHGPEHAKTFMIEVRVGREWVGQAEGRSKKSAAQNAARDLLGRIGDVASSPGADTSV